MKSPLSMCSILLFFVMLTFHAIGATIEPDKYRKEVRCLVCRAVVDEVDHILSGINPERKLDIGSYRLDAHGNQKQKKISYARSETHLSEVMDNICKKMEDYAKVRRKSDQQLMVIRLINHDNSMNVNLPQVDFIEDSELNKSLQYYCEGIVEEFEDIFLKMYAADADSLHKRICDDGTRLCDGVNFDISKEENIVKRENFNFQRSSEQDNREEL